MGCSSSMQNKKKLQRSDVSINLTDDQKNIIKKTWITIEENRTKIGKQTFIRVFELNPQIKKKMPEFMTADPIEELNSSKKLFGHSKTLMTCLENAVKSLDDNERFVAYLVELGRRHKVRPLKAPHLEVIHEALMFSLKEVFQSEWTTETSDSWSALFRYMSEAMIIGLNDTS